MAALRSCAINLPHLAERVEAAHFPDPTATLNMAPFDSFITDSHTATESAADAPALWIPAERVEAAHFLDTTATHNVPPQSTGNTPVP